MQSTIYRLASSISLEEKLNKLTQIALNLGNSSKEEIPKTIIDLYSLLENDKKMPN